MAGVRARGARGPTPQTGTGVKTGVKTGVEAMWAVWRAYGVPAGGCGRWRPRAAVPTGVAVNMSSWEWWGVKNGGRGRPFQLACCGAGLAVEMSAVNMGCAGVHRGMRWGVNMGCGGVHSWDAVGCEHGGV